MNLHQRLTRLVIDFDHALDSPPGAERVAEYTRYRNSIPPTKGEVLARFLAELSVEAGFVPGFERVERAVAELAAGAVGLPDGLTAQNAIDLVEEIRDLPEAVTNALEHLAASDALRADAGEYMRRMTVEKAARAKAALEGKPAVLPVYKKKIEHLVAVTALHTLSTCVERIVALSGRNDETGLTLDQCLPDQTQGATHSDMQTLFHSLHKLGECLEDDADNFSRVADMMLSVNRALTMLDESQAAPFSDELLETLWGAACPAP